MMLLSVDMILTSLENENADLRDLVEQLTAEREAQAAEIEKYKTLCDQMGDALKLFEPFDGEFEALQIKALEAWRAMK